MSPSRSEDEHFMRRALALARRGRYTASPNPMVGAVLVRRGKICSEGWHHFAGRPHAEALALRKDPGGESAILFVTLEPCVHYGKTPPCLDAILAAPVRRVVVAVRDADPRVGGRGIAQLRAAGREVTLGVLEREARFLNRMYFHSIRTGLPWVIVKWAATLDGRIADRRGRSAWITSEAARREGKRIREEVDAILVGSRTVLLDDPLLARPVEHPPRRPLLRIILDPAGRIPVSARVFSRGPVIWMTSLNATIRRVPPTAKLARLPSRGGEFKPEEILRRLSKEGVRSVLVEGGGETAGRFFKARCVQEAAVFWGPRILGGGVPAVAGMDAALSVAPSVELFQVRRIGADLFMRGLVCSPA